MSAPATDSGHGCVAFSGELELSEAEVAMVRRRLAAFERAELYVSGAAFGVDTVAALAAMDLFPDACHRVYVPAAWHNEEAVAELGRRGAEVIEVPASGSRAGSYMARNDRMVADCDVLLAFPHHAREELRSGTWATVRRARKARRRVVVEALRDGQPAGEHSDAALARVVDCRHSRYDVYIGRGRDPRGGEPGGWGNPFRVGVDGSRGEVIEKYRRRLWAEIQAGRVDLAALAALHGKTLGCWCAPRPCHGEVLQAAASWALAEQARRLSRRVGEMVAGAWCSGSRARCGLRGRPARAGSVPVLGSGRSEGRRRGGQTGAVSLSGGTTTRVPKGRAAGTGPAGPHAYPAGAPGPLKWAEEASGGGTSPVPGGSARAPGKAGRVPGAPAPWALAEQARRLSRRVGEMVAVAWCSGSRVRCGLRGRPGVGRPRPGPRARSVGGPALRLEAGPVSPSGYARASVPEEKTPVHDRRDLTGTRRGRPDP